MRPLAGEARPFGREGHPDVRRCRHDACGESRRRGARREAAGPARGRFRDCGQARGQGGHLHRGGSPSRNARRPASHVEGRPRHAEPSRAGAVWCHGGVPWRQGDCRGRGRRTSGIRCTWHGKGHARGPTGRRGCGRELRARVRGALRGPSHQGRHRERPSRKRLSRSFSSPGSTRVSTWRGSPPREARRRRASGQWSPSSPTQSTKLRTRRWSGRASSRKASEEVRTCRLVT